MKDDHIMSFFKFERKSNYKSGMYETLGLFESRFNFVMFYRVFIYESTFVHEQLLHKDEMDPAKILAFLETSDKEHL
jgi:hypothetical protein